MGPSKNESSNSLFQSFIWPICSQAEPGKAPTAEGCEMPCSPGSHHVLMKLTYSMIYLKCFADVNIFL